MDTPRFRKNKSWGCSLHSQVRACARWSGELSATSTSMFSRLKSQSVRNIFHFRSNTKNLHTWIEKPDSDDYYVRDLHSHLSGATTSDDVLKKRIALKFHQLNLRVHEQNASTETQEEQDCVLRHDLSRRCMRMQSVRESTQPHAPAETSRLVDSDSSSVVNIVNAVAERACANSPTRNSTRTNQMQWGLRRHLIAGRNSDAACLCTLCKLSTLSRQSRLAQ